MKCKFCGADLENINSRCEYCGKYQSEPTYDQPVNNNNKNHTVLFVLLGLGAILLIAVIIVLVFVLGNNSKDYKFIGKWTCNGGTELEFDSKTMIVKDKDVYVEASYKIDYNELNETPIGTFYKYGLTASANKRVIYGQEQKEPYSTQFEINIDKKDINHLLMINSLTYNMYECSKIN